MPFTLAEIEAVFNQKENDYYSYADYLENTNYPLIADYLTGKTTSLPSLDPAQPNIAFSPLIDLVKRPEAPSPDEQRVLDVLFDAAIFYQMQHYLLQWLSFYIIQHDEETVLQSCLSHFQRGGLPPAHVFEVLLHYLQYFPSAQEIINNSASPLRRFLLQHVPVGVQHRQQYYGAFAANDWNFLYFQLVEEAQPHLATQYLFNGLASAQPDNVRSLLQYQNGKYNPALQEWIQLPSQSEAELQAKFRTAIVLFEADAELYGSLIAEAAKLYLQQYPTYFGNYRWEGGYHLQQFRETEKSYLRFSALAVHFLMPNETEFVKTMVSDWHQKKIYICVDVFRMLPIHLKEEALAFIQQGLQTTTAVGGNDYYRSMIRLLTESFSPTAYLPVLWSLVITKSKVVKELVTQKVVEQDAEAEGKAIALLKHKNAEARQTGALILNSFNSTAAIAAVNELLHKETNDNARDIFLQIIKDHLPQTADAAFRQQLVLSAEQRNKLAKPVETWLDESGLPSLQFLSGEALTAKEVRFLFYRMSRVKGMRSDVEANYLLQHIDKEKADDFVKTILDKFIANGMKPDHKYLLALAGLLGTEYVVDRIRTLINRWIDEGRLKMAEYGVGALALQGSNKALRWVEWYSRKYKTKKASVGAAALKALQDAAEEQGITIHELADRVVPDFGFDGLFKPFTVNGDDFRAFIDSQFKLCYFNEGNRQLKALPAAAGKELKEEFKQISKEVRDVVRSQSSRMEYYLLMQRKWTSGAWKDFFLTNPVMFIYATKLLWGIYNEEGGLLNCFVCLEDTTLVTVNDDEMDVAENYLIGIVHPLEISAEQCEVWKRKFFDLSIEPVFPQLERLVYSLKPDDANRKIVQDFAGKETQPNSIKPTLERFGWRNGGTGDGGYIDSFQLDDSLHGILAVLEVEGVFVSFGWENEAKLGKLYFVDKKKQQNKWVLSPADEKDERLVALKDLSPVFYSEVMYNIHHIKLKSTDAVLAQPLNG